MRIFNTASLQPGTAPQGFNDWSEITRYQLLGLEYDVEE